ncbi:hypothetical protein V6N13_130092 [Hibiscus sabdariffa]
MAKRSSDSRNLRKWWRLDQTADDWCIVENNTYIRKSRSAQTNPSLTPDQPPAPASRRRRRLRRPNASSGSGSLVDLAVFQLCTTNGIYIGMSCSNQREVFGRCNGNWKRILRFLQSVEQSSDMVQTSAGNMQITTGRYHTLLIKNSSVYSCGSSLCGVLGHGPETTQCVAFTRINFPSPANVIQMSASQNHAAFVLQSGEVFTCGDNSSFCCGHRDPNPIFILLLSSAFFNPVFLFK